MRNKKILLLSLALLGVVGTSIGMNSYQNVVNKAEAAEVEECFFDGRDGSSIKSNLQYFEYKGTSSASPDSNLKIPTDFLPAEKNKLKNVRKLTVASNNYIKIKIPERNTAKIEIAFYSTSNAERSIFLVTEEKGITNNLDKSIFYLSSANKTFVHDFSSEIQSGNYYLNTTAECAICYLAIKVSSITESVQDIYANKEVMFELGLTGVTSTNDDAGIKYSFENSSACLRFSVPVLKTYIDNLEDKTTLGTINFSAQTAPNSDSRPITLDKSKLKETPSDTGESDSYDIDFVLTNITKYDVEITVSFTIDEQPSNSKSRSISSVVADYINKSTDLGLTDDDKEMLTQYQSYINSLNA